MIKTNGSFSTTKIVVAAVLVGAAVYLGFAGSSQAAPGWTNADIKGIYVGHWNGHCNNQPAFGLIVITADGSGNMSIAGSGDVTAFAFDGQYSVNSGVNGAILNAFLTGTSNSIHGDIVLNGYPTDRGKALDFRFFDTASCSRAGQVTIQ
jgi:hypothetical protein